LGYSSDVDDEEVRRSHDDYVRRRRTRTVAGGEKTEDILSSQASQESPTNKFHRILTAAIMEGLDRVDFSYGLIMIY
jgi:hypothetical protein